MYSFRFSVQGFLNPRLLRTSTDVLGLLSILCKNFQEAQRIAQRQKMKKKYFPAWIDGFMPVVMNWFLWTKYIYPLICRPYDNSRREFNAILDQL